MFDRCSDCSVSKRPNDSEEGGPDPQADETQDRIKRFNRNSYFRVVEWVNWDTKLFANKVRGFFDWRRIKKPEDYFTMDFRVVLNSKTDTFFCGARCHGLEAQDFAKVVLTVAHFVYRAAFSYPSNETHRKVLKLPRPNKQHFSFRPVPFGEIFAILGANAKDPELEFLLSGTGDGMEGKRLRLDTLTPMPTSDFQAHSKFLILALSLLLEYGVLEVWYQTYPTTKDTIKRDDLVPYVRHV